MSYLALFVMTTMGYLLLTALVNLLLPQKIPRNKQLNHDLVSVLIPARDEEKNIGNLLSDLKQLSNDNLEIIVGNDQSSDRTAEIVAHYAQMDFRIRIIDIDHLPEGWRGKNHACAQLAAIAMGDYYLFLDADVRISGNIIGSAVNYVKKHQLGLLSIFPRQMIGSRGEQLTVPLMHQILLSLLPLVLVRRSPFAAHAAANGQFMLFKGSTYNKLQPHKTLKSSPIEDIETARHFKKEGVNIACCVGDERITCRMYENLNGAINGFSKNVTAFFGGSRLLAVTYLFVITLGFGTLLTTPTLLPLYFAMLVAIITSCSLVAGQNTLHNLIFFYPQQYYLLRIIQQASINKQKKEMLWKGRNIYQ